MKKPRWGIKLEGGMVGIGRYGWMDPDHVSWNTIATFDSREAARNQLKEFRINSSNFRWNKTKIVKVWITVDEE